MDLSGIDCLGLDRVLKRGSGKIIAEMDGALLLRDEVSGAYMLACGDTAEGMALLDRHISGECGLLMVADRALGLAAYEKFGFSDRLECYQVAYYGKTPSAGAELQFRIADESDLPMLTENYALLSPEELRAVVKRGSVRLGYDRGRLVGFIGEHLEGSMGILYVFPEYRRRGFGAALQARLMARTIKQGYIPFGQVEKTNTASLLMQKKLGMTQSDRLIVWMWR